VRKKPRPTSHSEYCSKGIEARDRASVCVGEYALYVGSRTSKTHNEWVDAAVALQKSKFPKMMLITDKIETSDDPQVAYAKTKDLLRAHPNIKGFQGNG
jgi:simple sugar transport system substrate-binding protein